VDAGHSSSKPKHSPAGEGRLKAAFSVVKETVNDWLDDRAPRLAAALSYYTLLSIAPLVVISIAIAGLIFGPDAARGQIAGEIGGVVGADAARAIEAVVASARSPEGGVLSTVVGVIVLLFGASGVFVELQSALNTVWEVQPKPGRGILGEIRDRFFSFAMVLGVAFLLLVSLVLSAALSAAGRVFSAALPGGEVLWQALNFVFSFALVAGLFALIFKYVPDVKVRFRDVWLGALVTAFLFTVGKLLLGLYLGKASVGSSYGAAGSFIAFVVWVYYAAQIVFLGAEFTQVTARRRGAEIRPNENAVRVESEKPDAPHQQPSRA
jgi:membrane protein